MAGSINTEGFLMVVATPIGNLGDLSPRAREILASADWIYCEDTRRTRTLLSAHDIPSARRLVSLHEHNEAKRIERCCEEITRGKTVALVSDAGTPGISDPGQDLIAAVTKAGLSVSAVPGPSSVIAALVTSGFATDRFVVEGFLPRKGKERLRILSALTREERTTVILESPRRLHETLEEFASLFGGQRRIALAREMTKLHEEIWRGALDEAIATLSERELKGEIVLVLEGAVLDEAPPASDEEIRRYVDQAMNDGLTRRDAAHDAAALFSVSKRRAYEIATSKAANATGD